MIAAVIAADEFASLVIARLLNVVPLIVILSVSLAAESFTSSLTPVDAEATTSDCAELTDAAMVAADAPAATAIFVLLPFVSSVSVCAVTPEAGVAADAEVFAESKLAKKTVDAEEDVAPKTEEADDAIETDIVSLAFAPTWNDWLVKVPSKRLTLPNLVLVEIRSISAIS
jgi:hypothetical protein